MRDAAVLMLDALGTKGVWRSRDPEEYLETWQQLRDEALSAHSMLADIAREDDRRGDAEWRLWMFSDTMILVGALPSGIQDALDYSFALVLDASNMGTRLIAAGLRVGIRLRGALGFGPLAMGDEIVIGPVIDEVAANYESADWIGGHLTPSAEQIARRWHEHQYRNDPPGFSSPKQWDHLTWAEWDVPMRSGGSRRAFSLPWPRSLDFGRWASGEPSFSPDAREELLHDLRDMVKGPEDVRRKLANTLGFWDSFQQRFYDPADRGPRHWGI